MLSKLFKQKDIKEIVIKGIPGKDGVVTPTWATNPSSMRISTDLYFE